MSTWVYLKCLDHDPPLMSPDESGQHLYDLPQIRADLANRDSLISAYSEVDRDASVFGYFRGNTVRFLAQHAKCRIGIEDEYGAEHPLEDVQP